MGNVHVREMSEISTSLALVIVSPLLAGPSSNLMTTALRFGLSHALHAPSSQLGRSVAILASAELACRSKAEYATIFKNRLLSTVVSVHISNMAR